MLRNYQNITFIKNIALKENITITDKALDIISEISNGDLRKGINFLQSISMKSSHIDENICFESAGIPTNQEINTIYNLLLNKVLLIF